MSYKLFLIFFLIIYNNISFSYGLEGKLLKEIIEGELEILDTENISEERKLFDSLVLFFSEKNNLNQEAFIENLKKTAESNNPQASYLVGMYLLSNYPSFDTGSEIIKYLLIAAESGNVEAKTALAWIYSTGFITDLDPSKAFYWYRLAAEDGDLEASYQLGLLYNSGYGTDKNHQEAFKWLKKAASSNYSPAQYVIGLMYSVGRGTDQNFDEAYTWYFQSAQSGNVKALMNLGLMYLTGKGTNKDIVQAHKFLTISEILDYQDAKQNRLIIENEMSDHQIAESLKEVTQWFRKKREGDI
jgi:hypothetical protein